MGKLALLNPGSFSASDPPAEGAFLDTIKERKELGHGKQSICAHPEFVVAGTGNFNLTPRSPRFELNRVRAKQGWLTGSLPKDWLDACCIAISRKAQSSPLGGWMIGKTGNELH
jgi:hypothetical protein